MKPYATGACVVAALLLSACQSAHVEDAYVTSQALDLRDADKDGVINARDICAGTPSISAADNQGCAQQSGQLEQRDFVFTFNLNSDELHSAQKSQLDDIVNLVHNQPEATIALVGDTSSEGGDSYNHQLGIRRADKVTNELIARGIDPQRITGYVYDQTAMKAIMKKRERRTIVRVKYPSTAPSAKWTIYSAEQTMKTGARAKQ